MSQCAETLNGYLVKSQCFCLNEEIAPHDLASLIDGSGNGLKSNADEQLLIHLSLNTTFKLTSVKLLLPRLKIIFFLHVTYTLKHCMMAIKVYFIYINPI